MSKETQQRLSNTQSIAAFSGGMSVPAASIHQPPPVLLNATLAAQLTLPLIHRNSLRIPAVSIGQQVLKGERLDHGLHTQADSLSPSPATPPLLASSSGTVVAIDQRPIMHPLQSHSPCIVLNTDGEDHWHPEWQPDSEHWQTLTTQQKIKLIEQAAISGLGGAAYASGHKLTRFLDSQQAANKRTLSTQSLLIINAVECEPLIHCDAALLEHDLQGVLTGITTLLQLCKPERCIVAIEDGKPTQKKQLTQALQNTFSDTDHLVQLVQVPLKYPSGAEKQLIQLLTGKTLPRGSIPAEAGIVCLNVATVHAVGQLATSKQPLLTRIVTVQFTAKPLASAETALNIKTLFGTPARQLIEQADAAIKLQGLTPGSAKPHSDQAASLIVGGEFSGYAFDDNLAPVTASCNCIQLRDPTPAVSVSPCIRCGDCSAVCPADLLPQQLHWYTSSANLADARKFNLESCIECGCCDTVCPSQIPLTAQFRTAKYALQSQLKESARAAWAKQRFDKRQLRLERLQSERDERLRLRKLAAATGTQTSAKPVDSIVEPGVKPDRDAAKAAIAAAMERSRKKKLKPGTGDTNS